MAELEKMTVQLKILDLDNFKGLVSALGTWAVEMSAKTNMTEAETALFNAAVSMADDNTRDQSE